MLDQYKKFVGHSRSPATKRGVAPSSARPLADDAPHRFDDDSQHKIGEETFWHNLNLNPLLICEALHKVSPDVVAMRAVVFNFMAQRGSR